jgi:hypothetical protein
LCQLIFFSALFALSLWIYSRFSGQYANIGDSIDILAEVIYKQVYIPLCNALIQQAVHHGFSSITNVQSSSKFQHQSKKQD